MCGALVGHRCVDKHGLVVAFRVERARLARWETAYPALTFDVIRVKLQLVICDSKHALGLGEVSL